jgi:hypothetical protein
LSVSLIEAGRLLSFGLVVLIWLVQLIIYPSFGEIERGRFLLWHAGYTRAAWISTFAIAVPAHERLGLIGPDEVLIRRLIATNWIRTAAWSFAFALLLLA